MQSCRNPPRRSFDSLRIYTGTFRKEHPARGITGSAKLFSPNSSPQAIHTHLTHDGWRDHPNMHPRPPRPAPMVALALAHRHRPRNHLGARRPRGHTRRNHRRSPQNRPAHDRRAGRPIGNLLSRRRSHRSPLLRLGHRSPRTEEARSSRSKSGQWPSTSSTPSARSSEASPPRPSLAP